jgi:hypothetical protein
VKPPPYLHNLLNCLRVALAPALVGAAYSNAKTGFVVVLGLAVAAGVVGDLVPGDEQAENGMARALERWADRLLVGGGTIGFALLWPAAVGREWIWMALGLAGYLAAGIGRGRGERRQVAPWMGDVLGTLTPLALLVLIATGAAWPFRATVLVQVLAGVGQMWPAKATNAKA